MEEDYPKMDQAAEGLAGGCGEKGGGGGGGEEGGGVVVRRW